MVLFMKKESSYILLALFARIIAKFTFNVAIPLLYAGSTFSATHNVYEQSWI